MSDAEFTAIPVRPCIKCGSTERGKDGKCKACVKARVAAWKKANPEKKKAGDAARYAADPSKQKAATARYRAAHPEKRRAQDAAWRKANPEKIKAMKAAAYAADPKKHKARKDAWRAKNPDKEKAAHSAWRAANPEACKIHDQNRRALEKKSGGKLSRGLSEKLFKLQKGKCPCCKQPLGDDYHLDHKMPLKLGGLNTDENMQLLRAACNLQKHKKHPIDFMQSRGFLL